MTAMSPEEIDDLKRNIHPAGHAAITDWQRFDWHRSRSGAVDSQVRHSSQAFCISVWGSLSNDALGRGVANIRQGAMSGLAWDFLDQDCRVSFEFSDGTLLNELGTPQATSIDALLEFDSHIVTVESKLTEELGPCNQARRGACSGKYAVGSDLRTESQAPCRLQIPEGRRTARRYWEVMESIARPGSLAPGIACPFAGSAYQVMRNIASAVALAERERKDWRALFAFPGSSGHDTTDAIVGVVDLLAPEYQSKVAIVDYNLLAEHLSLSNDRGEQDLAIYMRDRLSLVGR